MVFCDLAVDLDAALSRPFQQHCAHRRNIEMEISREGL